MSVLALVILFLVPVAGRRAVSNKDTQASSKLSESNSQQKAVHEHSAVNIASSQLNITSRDESMETVGGRASSIMDTWKNRAHLGRSGGLVKHYQEFTDHTHTFSGGYSSLVIFKMHCSIEATMKNMLHQQLYDYECTLKEESNFQTEVKFVAVNKRPTFGILSSNDFTIELEPDEEMDLSDLLRVLGSRKSNGVNSRDEMSKFLPRDGCHKVSEPGCQGLRGAVYSGTVSSDAEGKPTLIDEHFTLKSDFDQGSSARSKLLAERKKLFEADKVGNAQMAFDPDMDLMDFMTNGEQWIGPAEP